MSKNSEAYNRLKERYDELQLRVTQFSTIEQQLINTRDRLDHELVMYKRFSQFIGQALKTEHLPDFLQLVAESIVDIFEVESALVAFQSTKKNIVILKNEGFEIPKNEEQSILEDIHQLTPLFPDGGHIITQEDLADFNSFNHQSAGLYFGYKNPEEGFHICLLGLNSIENLPIYQKPESRNTTMFSVFGQQIKALISNQILKTDLGHALSQKDQLLKKVDSLKKFYESVLNYAPAKIAVLSPDKKVRFINNRLQKEEPVWENKEGLSVYSFFKKDSAFLEGLSTSLQSRSISRFEETFIRKNNTKKHVLRSILPHYEDNRELDYIVCFGVDISNLKKAQEDMELQNLELQKINGELDNFVYSVSHDLRSPLLSIKGIFELLFSSKTLSAQSNHLLTLAQNSVNRLDLTIQEILTYSRNARMEVEFEEFNFSELTSNIIDDLKFSHKKEVKFTFKNEGNVMMFSDRTRVSVLLKNTLGNAFKYQRENIKNPKVGVEFKNRASQYQIIVTDNGEGIHKKNLDKVFNMFFRANEKSIGTGLGLYICKEITNKMGGELLLDSTRGKGTMITIEIPKVKK